MLTAHFYPGNLVRPVDVANATNIQIFAQAFQAKPDRLS